MIRILSIIVLVAVAGCSKNGSRDETGPRAAGAQERPRLERAEPLPALVRDILRINMLEHGDSMESLLWAALMLDHQTTETITQRILLQPRMARPTPAAPDTINEWLPERFFELQDEMYAAAGELSRAAQAKDDLGMAQAYGKLAQTCVTCHSLYLTLPGEAGKEGDEM